MEPTILTGDCAIWATRDHSEFHPECLKNGSTFAIAVQEVTDNYMGNRIRPDLVSLSHGVEPFCVTINGNATYVHHQGSFLNARLYPRRNSWWTIYVNSPNETYHESSGQEFYATRGIHAVRIKSKSYSGLGPPYSDCAADDNEQNIFHGVYTHEKCKKTCIVKKMLDKCERVAYHHAHYIPNHWKSNKPITMSVKESEACLKELGTNTDIKEECDHGCEIACNFTYYVPTFQWKEDSGNFTLDLDFALDTTVVEGVREEPLHTWQDLFSNFGGILGLMCGASVLSAIEILIIFCLFLYERIPLLHNS